MAKIELNIPRDINKILELKAGDTVSLTGTIYTGRDQAHLRLISLIEQGNTLPFDLDNSTIYYTGPSPAAPGQIIGAVGPTTSYRMDPMTPPLLDRGLKIMIGKGKRSDEVIDSITKNGAVYLSAIGGAGALYQQVITSCKLVAFPELLAEGIHKLEVKDFPAIVFVDSQGNTL